MAVCGGQEEAPSSGPALIVGATGCVDALQHKGAVIVEGHVGGKDGRELVETVLRAHGVEVVISAMGGDKILDQLGLIEAIQAAGTVKEKRRVRRAAEASGVPYTYICCNSIAGWPYFDKTHPSEVPPSLDRFQIYGDGTVRAFFVAGTDIGKFTVMADYDAQGINKAVHFRPAYNLLSTNEMASLWESKIGRTLPRVTLSEEDLLAMAAEDVVPASIVASLTHDIFINGCQTNYPIDDGSRDVEISDLYPEILFRTVDECFDEYVRGLDLGLEVEEATGNKKSNPPETIVV